MLPISLRPDDRRAVVVGGGNAAVRKAESLDAAGFRILVVACKIDAALRTLLARPRHALAERAYERGDLDGAALVVAATGDADVNARVLVDAREARVLACDASAPQNGDFTMAAALRIGDLTIAVDSGGSSPAFSKRVVRELGAALGPQYADALKTLARMRSYTKATFPKEERVDILRELAERPVAELAAMSPTTLVCASRGSALAMKQTRTVAARLAERGIATTILNVTTTGDRDRQRPIDQLGNNNVFVTELEAALRERRADYAVHSCKDLPSDLAGDMQLAAISAREDPRDAFCSERYRSFEALPAGAIVGTSSPRRRAQLAALRPDLRYEEMRGNVDTRLRKLQEGRYAAIVLAMAGLNRLRLRAAHTVAFEIETVVPAVGQGALAVETRAGDEWLAQQLRHTINDAYAELCVRCERAALRELRAGCSAPIGIHAVLTAGTMTAYGSAAGGDAIARERIERSVSNAQEAEALGAELAQRLRPAATPAAPQVGVAR